MTRFLLLVCFGMLLSLSCGTPDEEEALQRLNAQRPWTDREPASDHVFHNDGTLDGFISEVDAQIERTLELYRADSLPTTRWFEWREQNPRPQRTGTRS